VQRARFASLEGALHELERQAIDVAQTVPRKPVDLKVRQFDPAQQVSARLELAGPERFLPSVHAGLDIHGDGSMVAYRGQVRKKTIDPEAGEDAVEALKRALSQQS
jgi:hypothetical protein